MELVHRYADHRIGVRHATTCHIHHHSHTDRHPHCAGVYASPLSVVYSCRFDRNCIRRHLHHHMSSYRVDLVFLRPLSGTDHPADHRRHRTSAFHGGLAVCRHHHHDLLIDIRCHGHGHRFFDSFAPLEIHPWVCLRSVCPSLSL